MILGLLRNIAPIGLVLTIAAAPPARVGVAFVWNGLALDPIRTGDVSPPRASRAPATTHGAAFDAVNSVDRSYQPHHVPVDAAPGTSLEATTGAAAHTVRRSLSRAEPD